MDCFYETQSVLLTIYGHFFENDMKCIFENFNSSAALISTNALTCQSSGISWNNVLVMKFNTHKSNKLNQHVKQHKIFYQLYCITQHLAETFVL